MTLFRTICVAALLMGPSSHVSGMESVQLHDIPHIRQKPDFCGEACVAMALQHLGKQADQDFVFDQSGLSPLKARGCYTRELTKAVRESGFSPGAVWYPVTPASANNRLSNLFGGIVADLNAGHPTVVCMHYDDRPGTTEHLRLITGYDRRTDDVIYHEPAVDEGRHRRMSRARFPRLWPLKYRSDEWTVVMLRMKPTSRLRGETSSRFTDADYAQHIMKLRRRFPGENFTIVLQKPFVVVGDKSAETVKRRSVQTVKWAVDRLRKDYFTKDPRRIIDVWLFGSRESYETNAKQLFGRKPGTPYGYYSSSDRALVMNIKTGGGTLAHEIVHPFIESNFPDCPSWFNEGLASLYEQCRDRNGHIHGSTNWRLAGLQRALARKSVPSFKSLCSTTRAEFYNEDPGTNYSQARYLCYYLQEQGLLRQYYHAFRKNAESDPTGYETLQKVLGVRDMKQFRERWEAYTAGLSFP